MGRHAHAEWRYCLPLAGSYTDSWRRGHRTRTVHQLSLHPAEEMHTSIFHTAVTCFHIEYGGAWRDRLLGEAGIAPEPHEFLDGRIPLIARQLHDEFARGAASSRLVLEGLACELVGWSARALRTEAADAPWLERACELLRDRFTEPLTITELAREAGVHPVRLARHFRRAYGCTIGQYVRELKVDFAVRELRTGASLAAIAQRTGFSDQSHFTRVFKRATGITPGEYRRRC